MIIWAGLWGCSSPEKEAERLYQQGLRQQADGRFQEALTHFQEVLRLDPQHVGARIETGVLLCRFGRYAECVKHLLKAHELDPAALQPLTYLGYAYQQLEQWPLAETYYVMALQRAPNLVDVSRYLAEVLEFEGKYARAIAILEELLSRYPQYERAEIIRTRIAVLREPASAGALLQLAGAYVHHGEIDRGLEAYQRAWLADAGPGGTPLSPELWAKFGIFCAEREQFEAAIAYLTRAIERNFSAEAELWHWLGRSYDLSGNLPAAIDAYQQALHLQPERSATRHRLLALLERTGRKAEAADLLEQGFYAGYLSDTNAVWSDILRLRGEAAEKAVVQLTSAGRDEFLLNVVAGDSQPATFLLDPRAEYTIISEELAQQLQILLSVNTSVVHFYYRGQRYTPYLINLSAITVGQLAVRNVKTLVLDLSDVVPPIDGVLGETFLKHFEMQIDREHQLLVLTKLYS